MATAPEWTPEQCAAFNAGQLRSDRHPYTCGTDSRHGLLVAKPDGLHCPDCDYRQFWAHGLPDLPGLAAALAASQSRWYDPAAVAARLRRLEAGESLLAVYADGPGATPDDLGGGWATRLHGRDQIVAVREWLALADDPRAGNWLVTQRRAVEAEAAAVEAGFPAGGRLVTTDRPLRCIVVEVGGKPPGVKLWVYATGQTVRVRCSEEYARRVAAKLAEDAELPGRIMWDDVPSLRLVRFTPDEDAR